MRQKIVTLDVRPELKAGREPFGKIMHAVGTLEEGQDLLLLAPFEPAPLYEILAGRGFAHQTTATAGGDFEVLFSKRPLSSSGADCGDMKGSRGRDKRGAGPASKRIEVDAKGLEPPGPLVKILEALEALPEGASLRAHTDRRPMHLYPRIEERGFVAESQEQEDGSFITDICRG